jgi:myo-inositol-1(or 4)-monophosphatase
VTALALQDDVRAVVAEAGRLAMRHFRTDYARWEKGPGQIVTEADLAVDELLKERLLRLLPDAAWLSEETPDDRLRLGQHRVWVVDPIDGTRSFVAGVPEFTVSVALIEDGRPVLGFVLNPATAELFEATRDGSTFLNGALVHGSDQRSLSGARILCSSTENRRRNFKALLPTAEVATIGSLAYKLALVAAGRFAGYLSWRYSHDWDIAAAVLLLARAGVRITDANGMDIVLNRPDPRHDGLLAAPAALHATMLEALAPARAELLARRALPT